MSDVLLESVVVCPVCGFAELETMPVDACQILYECTHCKTLLRPKPGDCCVFCSYGSVRCPPKQRQIFRSSFCLEMWSGGPVVSGNTRSLVQRDNSMLGAVLADFAPLGARTVDALQKLVLPFGDVRIPRQFLSEKLRTGLFKHPVS
jgi:hypothetical protein